MPRKLYKLYNAILKCTIFFGYRTGFHFQNNPENLEPSYKMDLDFLDCFGKENPSHSMLQIRRGNWDNLGIISHISP